MRRALLLAVARAERWALLLPALLTWRGPPSAPSLTPGWYVSDVWINWSLTNISPPLTVDCPPVHLVNDTTAQTATCSATDASGTTTKTTTTRQD